MIILKFTSLLPFILIWFYVTIPLFDLYYLADGADKPYPYRMLFPYNANKPVAYAITYFFTSFAGFGVVCNLFAEDSLFAFFTTHTCGRFRLLHEHISNVIRNGQERALEKKPNLMTEKSEVRSIIIQREYRANLIRIIQDHNVLIR